MRIHGPAVVFLALVGGAGCKKAKLEKEAGVLAEERIHSVTIGISVAYAHSGHLAGPAQAAAWGREPTPPVAEKRRTVPATFSVARGTATDEGRMGAASELRVSDGPPDDPDCSRSWTASGDDSGTLVVTCFVEDVSAMRTAKVTCVPADGLCTEALL